MDQSAGADGTATPDDMVAGYASRRRHDMLDVVVTAAALVARADCRVDPAERRQLLDFLARARLLPVVRFDAREAFERRVRELREPGGLVAAVDRLAEVSGRSLARLVVDAGWEVAAADSRLDPREKRVLDLIGIALSRHGLDETIVA